MGEPAYNLVIVKGDKKDLDSFAQIAYEDESRAFNINRLLPLPHYLSDKEGNDDEVLAFNRIVYGSKWVGAFSILIENNNSFLKYFFNSKYYKANLDCLAKKFNTLKFTHFYFEYCEAEKCGVIEYKNGERILELNAFNDNFDWQISTDIHTYLFIEELFFKFMFLFKSNPEILKELEYPYSKGKNNFFEIYNQSDYFEKNKLFYESIYKTERELGKRELDFAKNTFYRFITNSTYFLEKFIVQCFQDPEKSKYLTDLKSE